MKEFFTPFCLALLCLLTTTTSFANDHDFKTGHEISISAGWKHLGLDMNDIEEQPELDETAPFAATFSEVGKAKGEMFGAKLQYKYQAPSQMYYQASFGYYKGDLFSSEVYGEELDSYTSDIYKMSARGSIGYTLFFDWCNTMCSPFLQLIYIHQNRTISGEEGSTKLHRRVKHSGLLAMVGIDTRFNYSKNFSSGIIAKAGTNISNFEKYNQSSKEDQLDDEEIEKRRELARNVCFEIILDIITYKTEKVDFGLEANYLYLPFKSSMHTFTHHMFGLAAKAAWTF